MRTARTQAVKTANAILREHPDSLWGGHPWRMEVMNEEHGVVATLYFSIQPPKLDG